jgi:hypothetical protein
MRRQRQSIACKWRTSRIAQALPRFYNSCPERGRPPPWRIASPALSRMGLEMVRRLSFRAIFVAAALIFQTVAGGTGLAAGAGGAAVPVSAFCESGDANGSRQPADKQSHKHDGLACRHCAACAPAALPDPARRAEGLPSAALSNGFAIPGASSAPCLDPRAHQARAPPTFI